MAATFLLVLIFAVILLLFFIFKKLFKWFFIVSIIFFVVFSILAFMVYRDAMNLKQLPRQDLLLLMEKDGAISLAGDVNMESQLAKPRTAEETEAISNHYKAQAYAELLGSSSRAFIFKQEYIETILAKSEDKQLLGAIQDESQPQDIRFQAFITGVAQSFASASSRDTASFFEAHKQGDIMIYPETIVFKLVKIIPADKIIGLFIG